MLSRLKINDMYLVKVKYCCNGKFKVYKTNTFVTLLQKIINL